VRWCYTKLFRLIIAKEGYHRFLIRGNPGIGKTYFLYWLLVKLVSEGRVVVWNRSGHEFDFKCFNSPLGQARRASNLQAFANELNDPETYYLVDSISNPGEVSAFTILVASPRKKNYKQFDKYPGVFRYYMPLWDYGELNSLYYYKNLPREDFIRRYFIFSGIPRFIFEEQKEEELLRQLETVNLEKAMHAFESLESDQDISHYLIQMVPNEKYDNYHIEPLSTDIAQRITDKFIDQSKQRLLEFWENSKSNDFTNLSTFKGAIFENVAHRILAKGDTFEIYGPLGDKDATWSNIQIPVCTDKITPDFEISNDSTYYRPVSSKFPVIDSWIGLLGFFQITIASKHILIAQHLAKYIDISKQRNCNSDRIYFVVPSKERIMQKQPYNYDSYKKQKTSKKKQKTAEKTFSQTEATKLLSELKQFVLVLDLESHLQPGINKLLK